MYKIQDRIKLRDIIVKEIQSKIYGTVQVLENLIEDEQRIRIIYRGITCEFDLTEALYKAETELDADKLVHNIMLQYKEYILGAYIVGN